MLTFAIEEDAHAITGQRGDYDGLLDLIGDRRLVLIGEASHGTHDFYRERARITRRLIDECGFSAVAIEADWPDAYRVNRYVMGLSDDGDANTALSDFRRFPAWMWRNRDVLAFVEWLRARNDAHFNAVTKARFYGLDLYSLRASIEAVVDYLDRVDPDEATRARARYSCFDHVGAEGQAYGYALAHLGAIPCENEVVTQLIELRRRAESYLRRDGWVADDEFFFAEQIARLVRDAEEYYQKMYRSLSISTASTPERRSSYGSTIRMLEMLDPPRWVHGASSTSGSSLGSATARSPCWSGSPHSTARLPRLATGAVKPSASECERLRLIATKLSSTTAAASVSG